MPAEWKFKIQAKDRLVGPGFWGPGTIATIIGLLLIVGWQLLVPPKVTIERRVETSGQATVERKPSISELLSWSNDLQLTAAQKESLAKLSREEAAKLAPITSRIARAMHEFTKFGEQHKSMGVRLHDLQAEVAPIQMLSRQKRVMEHYLANQGWVILTEDQRQKANLLWQEKQRRWPRKMTGEARP
jgi:hypothetical protein